MIELLRGFPDHVAAYKVVGHVDETEYESIVMKRVDEAAARYDMINILVLLDSDIQHNFNAFIDYLKISFKHFSQWNRMAIVTDELWVRAAYESLTALVHGVVRGFNHDDFDVARLWVSEPLINDLQAYYN